MLQIWCWFCASFTVRIVYGFSHKKPKWQAEWEISKKYFKANVIIEKDTISLISFHIISVRQRLSYKKRINTLSHNNGLENRTERNCENNGTKYVNEQRIQYYIPVRDIALNTTR